MNIALNYRVILPGGGGTAIYGLYRCEGYGEGCRCEGYGFQAVYSRIGYSGTR